VTTDRLIDIFALIAQHEREDPHGVSLCEVAAEITELSGAGIAITSGGEHAARLCTSNRIAGDLMNLEITVGEGPGTDAGRTGLAVDEQNLLQTEIARWVIYKPGAVAAGAQAVFGFPIRIGAARFGSLSLFRDQPGPLSEPQASDAYLMASVIGRAILAMQAGAHRGGLASELEGQSNFDFSIHQAAGMVAVQGSMTVKDALVMLRAHAFAINKDLSMLAISVVARRTHFDQEVGNWIEVSGASDQ
jgi:hypothetical protein